MTFPSPADQAQPRPTAGTAMSPEPWRRDTHRTRQARPRPGKRALGQVVPVVVGTGLLVATAMQVWAEESSSPAEFPAAVLAGRVLPAGPMPPPLGGDGLELVAAAAFGTTAAAVGAQGGATGDRGVFLVTVNGGREWQAARVRGPAGQVAVPGERPRLVAGGPGGWVAIGDATRAAGPGAAVPAAVVWTSPDARAWTRQADDAVRGFGVGDRVTAVARSSSGMVAAEASSPPGSPSRPVVWTSADGTGWQAHSAAELGLAGAGAVTARPGSLESRLGRPRQPRPAPSSRRSAVGALTGPSTSSASPSARSRADCGSGPRP